MSTNSTATKNIIFVTGNGLGKYKELAEEIACSLYRSVLVSQPYTTPYHYQSASEYARERTLFFSKALFYGSLPSRRNIVVSIPELTMRVILQFMLLFENIKKDVFVVVDDRYFITSFCKDKFMTIIKKFPIGHAYFFTDFSMGKPTASYGVEKLIDRISFNSNTATEASLRDFNDILSSIPELFREEIKRSVFGTEFGDVPFNMLVKNLLPDFNDCEDEDEEGKKRLRMCDGELSFPPKKTIPDYFMPIKRTQTKDMDVDEYNPELPPPFNPEGSEDDYISLLEIFPETEDDICSLKKSSTADDNNSN